MEPERRAELVREGVAALTAWNDQHNEGGMEECFAVFGCTAAYLVEDPDREQLAGVLVVASQLVADLALIRQTSVEEELQRVAWGTGE
jgi:hypothetical protein